MTDYVTRRLDSILAGYRPTTEEQAEPPVNAGEELLKRDPALWKAAQDHLARKAAADEQARKVAEAREAIELLSEATGLPWADVQRRLSRTQGENEAIARAFDPDTRTRADQVIEQHEANARRYEANGATDLADHELLQAEAIRRGVAQEQADGDALVAATQARYFPPQEGEGEGESDGE